MQEKTLLEVKGLSKSFGRLKANDQIELSIERGHIHALLGENGAGKSTLVKLLYGALQPDEGSIAWQGRSVRIDDPATARRLGIGMVFQHFSLFDALTVAENIALALPANRSLRNIARELAEVSRAYGLPVDPESHIADLSAGQRQRAEIVRCLMQDPSLIILDEPTSVLTPQEADDLFVTLRRLADEGRAVLYISHKLDEVRRLCHRATILRHGRVVARCDPSRETPASLARMMVGADVVAVSASAARSAGDVLLEAASLSAPSPQPFGTDLHDIGFRLHAGRIHAIAGIAGNGQSELFDVLSGELLLDRATDLRFRQAPIGRQGINARRRLGMAFVSENRLGHGTAPAMSLSENLFLSRAATDPGLVPLGLLNRWRARTTTRRIIKQFDVRSGRRDPEARQLSGGNLQKYVVGRELDRKPDLLVIDQPTWGVDAGAAARIRQALIDLAAAGAAVLVISQDLDEIFEIADVIAVLDRGRLSPFEPAIATNREALGLLMGGHAAAEQHAAAFATAEAGR